MSNHKKADLDAIENRLNLATPGPWLVKDQDPKQIHRGTVQVQEDGRGVEVIAECYCGAYDGHGLRNAELIAHAPTDLAALIEEIRYLRGERAVAVEFLRGGAQTHTTIGSSIVAKALNDYANWIENGSHRCNRPAIPIQEEP